jgi:hypothetical protein
MTETSRLIPVTLAFLAISGAALAQTSVPATTASGAASALTELDTFVKLFVAGITGLGALLGLPIVLLTYRKTRAEITKLELEGNALREKQSTQGERSRDEEGNIRILVDRSPNTSIQVLADPRFLAPLLLLLDFIFAWVVLTLANYLLAVFSFGLFRQLALVVLAVALLFPIARQVLRVRTILRPQRTSEEIQAAIRKTKIAVYLLYATLVLSSFLFGALLLNTNESGLTTVGRYLAWFLLSWGALLVVLVPIGKPRFDRFILKLHKSDTQ